MISVCEYYYSSFNRGGTRTRNIRLSTLIFKSDALSIRPQDLVHFDGYNIMPPVHYSS